MQLKVLLLISLFLLGATVSSNTDIKKDKGLFVNKKEIKIYIVNSYEVNHFCGSPQYQGFKSVLYENKKYFNFKIRSFYMNTRTKNVTDEEKKIIAKHVLKKIEEFKPDVVVTIDDAAFEYVGIPASKKYKVFFSGINKSFEEYKKVYQNVMNVSNISGVEEIFRFVKAIDIFKEFQTIYILGDSTDISKILYNNFSEELNRYKIPFNFVKFETIQELHKFIKQNNFKKELIYLVTTQSLINVDNNKYYLMPDILKYIKEINKSALVVTGNPYSINYIHMTVSPDFYYMGRETAEVLLSYLTTNIVPRIREARNFITINKELVDLYGFNYIYARHPNVIDKIIYNDYTD